MRSSFNVIILVTFISSPSSNFAKCKHSSYINTWLGVMSIDGRELWMTPTLCQIAFKQLNIQGSQNYKHCDPLMYNLIYFYIQASTFYMLICYSICSHVCCKLLILFKINETSQSHYFKPYKYFVFFH
jgi:hypothetical protein